MISGPSARNGGGEQGFVLLWMALMLTVLIGAAAFAIDFSNRSRVGTNLQKAADAAALAGATFLPENLDDQAFTTARDVARTNGFDPDDPDTTVEVGIGNRPTQLVVTISQRVPSILAQVLGIVDATITRSATSEYERPIALGSPLNQYGNDPERDTPEDRPNFWANVYGPDSAKHMGDALQANRCPPASGASPTDNCDPSLGNLDYDPDGYFFAIQVTSSAQPLRIEVFDPALVYVHDSCGDTSPSGWNLSPNLAGAAVLTPAQIPEYPADDPFPPSERYSPASNSPFCTGDMYWPYGQSQAAAPPPTRTTWLVRAPDDIPHDPTTNPIIESCTREYPGFLGDVAQALQSGGPAEAPLVEHFRRWVLICEIPNPTIGTYYLQVTTAKDADGAALPLTRGGNRYSVRAGLGADLDGTDVRLHGDRFMGMYANAQGNVDTTFHLARILPGDASRRLMVRLYDIGDGPGGVSGTLRILPPTDATVDGEPLTTFEDCSYTPPVRNIFGTKPPFGIHAPTQPGCLMTNVQRDDWYGHWVEVRVPIPAGYDCDTEGDGCWTRINYNFNGTLTDTTTWTAFIDGGTVRIIE